MLPQVSWVCYRTNNEIQHDSFDTDKHTFSIHLTTWNCLRLSVDLVQSLSCLGQCGESQLHTVLIHRIWHRTVLVDESAQVYLFDTAFTFIVFPVIHPLIFSISFPATISVFTTTVFTPRGQSIFLP